MFNSEWHNIVEMSAKVYSELAVLTWKWSTSQHIQGGTDNTMQALLVSVGDQVLFQITLPIPCFRGHG
jgi:hypothetical protein